MSDMNNNKAIRVLHVMGAMNRAGAESRLMELLRKLKNSEVHSDICVFSDRVGDYEPEIKNLGIKVSRCKLSKNIFSFIWRFYCFLKQGQYDVVDCNVLLFSGVCLAVARCVGIPKRVIHVHNTSDARKTNLFRRLYRNLMLRSISRNATDIIGVSNAVLKSWFGGNWQDSPKMHVIYNGLDTTAFHCQPDPDWLKREFDVPSGYKTITHVGSFVPQKRHSKLVEIAATYLEQYSDTCFILVGVGSLMSKIKELVTKKGLGDKFRFAGLRTDVPKIMKSTDAFLLPSGWEGLHGVIQEAFAAGLPMVVIDLPGTREVLAVCGRAEILPVGASNDKWASALKKAVDTPKQTKWLEQLEGSDFAINNALKKLLCVYGK